MSLFDRTIKQLQNDLQSGELTVSDLVDYSVRRIAEVDGKVRAFLSVHEELARETAAKLDERLKQSRSQNGGQNGSQSGGQNGGQDRGASGLLFGLPAGIKDNIVADGLPTTCASRHLADYTGVYDATALKKLYEEQAVVIGKLNMDEFAMGSSTENSAFHPTYNPWNLEHVPGGSSGGSAAAVAAGEVYFALGSDTGGSIRQPASFCGVVGLKPTYGRVSRFGLVAFASSFDQIGPITKNVEDAAFVLQAISGHDPLDSTSANVPVPDFSAALTGDVRGLKIGIPKEYMGEGVAPAVKDAVMNAVKVLESLGATTMEVSMPHTEYALAAYYLLASSEASSNLARFDGIRYGARSANADNLLEVYTKSRSETFGAEVKRRIMLGTYALSSGYYDAYYLKAQKVRTLIKRDFDEAFAQVDLLLSPTTPTTAFKAGTLVDDPLTMYLNDILTIPVNLAGVPAISVPCGFSEGLPIGLQLIGKPFDEATMLRAAHAFEQNTEFHKMRPEL